jgi:uncharacterized protein (TIGR02266 family)
MVMADNQRSTERKAIRVEFRSSAEGGAGELVFTTLDVSVGGAFLESELLFEEGERLWVEVNVSSHPTPIRAQARIAWVRRFPQEGERPGMGLQFIGMSEEDRAALEQFLATSQLPSSDER